LVVFLDGCCVVALYGRWTCHMVKADLHQ